MKLHKTTAAAHTALVAFSMYLAGLSPATIHALHLPPATEQIAIGLITLIVSLTSPLRAQTSEEPGK